MFRLTNISSYVQVNKYRDFYDIFYMQAGRNIGELAGNNNVMWTYQQLSKY